jgi:hypothetical protein
MEPLLPDMVCLIAAQAVHTLCAAARYAPTVLTPHCLILLLTHAPSAPAARSSQSPTPAEGSPHSTTLCYSRDGWAATHKDTQRPCMQGLGDAPCMLGAV